ncbi:MAG: hypothetical protein E7182_01800 [Erysipelotrichaceae bacterium]|nr:hypothetical protein [Erysipelotrichaceae bacterium]
MNLIGEYQSVAEAAKVTGVASANICRAFKHNYHPIQKGFYFTYKKKLSVSICQYLLGNYNFYPASWKAIQVLECIGRYFCRGRVNR